MNNQPEDTGGESAVQIIPIVVQGGQHALLNLAFYGSSRKSVVLTREGSPTPIEMLSCIHDSRNCILIMNHGLPTTQQNYTLTLSCTDHDCSGSGNTTGLTLVRYAAAQDSSDSRFAITRYLYGSGAQPGDKVGITIILQEGVGPTTGDIVVL